MQVHERTSLLHRHVIGNNGLSVFFAIICVVDVFGVFPIVALPKAIIDCGYYGIIVICLICSVQIYTAILLGKCWTLAEEMHPTINRKNRYPYSALAEITFGKYSSYYVTFMVNLTVFGGGIPNLIVEKIENMSMMRLFAYCLILLKFLASQNLQLLGLRISNYTFDISFCYWIIILGTILCPILWLGSPKDMKVLCGISVLIVISVFVLTCGCLIFTTETEIPIIEDASFDANLDLWKLMMTAYGIVAFQFDIHPSILNIQMDMKEKTKLRIAVIGGFLVSLIMSAITTLIAVLKYGPATKPSILETLPTSVPLHFAAALVAIQLCLTSAVSNSALYQHMEDCLNISREFNHKRCILRTILTILAIVIAESVPRFDIVMSLIGGTLTGPLIFILPPLFYIKMLYLHRKYKERIESETFTNIILTRPVEEAIEQSEEYSRDLTKYYAIRFQEEFKNGTDWKLDWLFKWLCNTKMEISLCGFICFGGICATVVATYLNVSNAAISYANISKPCIYNVSVALLYL